MMLSLCVDGTASAKEKKLAKYDGPSFFSDGLARVEKDEKPAFIDKTGKVVLE